MADYLKVEKSVPPWVCNICIKHIASNRCTVV